MKKNTIIILIFCCFFAFSFSVKANIKGVISNANQGDSIFLVDPLNRQSSALETVALDKKGAFEFRYTPTEIGFYFIICPNNQSVLVVLKPTNSGQIHIDAATGFITKSIDSKENNLLKSFQEINLGFVQRSQALEQATDKTSEQKQLAKQALEQEQLTAISKMLLENATNYSSAALIEYLQIDDFFSVHDSVLGTLLKIYPNNFIVQAKYQEVASKKQLAIGYPAPEISLTDTSGKVFSLSSLKGKVVLIDFWAAWCRPCRMENPNMVRLYQTYKQHGFDILGVSLDQNRDNWIKAIKDDGLLWNQVSDLKGWQSAAGVSYGVRSIPFTVLVDMNGNIIAKGLRGDALEQKIKEALLLD